MILFALVFPISLGTANAILGLLLLVWLIQGDYRNKFTIVKQKKIVWIFFAIAGLTLVSALLSTSMDHSFLASGKKSLIRVIFSHYMLLPFIIVIFITSIQKKYLETIVSAFLLAILFSEFMSYLIYFQIIDVASLQSKHLIYKLASHTNPTPFMHHLEYSVFLSIASVLLLHKILHTQNKYLQLFMILFLTSATINLFINGGRTGQISYILAIATYMFFYFKFNFKIIIATLLGLTTVVTIAYNFSPTFQKRSHMALQDIEKISHNNYHSSWGQRTASNKVVLDYVSSSPTRFIFGAGAGDSKQTYNTYAKENLGKNISNAVKTLPHLHNQYLQYWMDGTLFALMLFIVYFILLFKLNVPNQYKPLLYAFGIIIIFSSATDIPFFRYQPAMLFYLITAYCIMQADTNTKDIEQ